MKYWRGYLVAALVAACGWGLSQFAASHVVLVDMIYPYVSRMIMEYMAAWSAGMDALVWQVLLVIGAVLLLTSIVLMIVLRWNPIQWFGWVLTAVSVVFLLHTGIYGLNEHTGPLAEDIRLTVNEPSAATYEAAALYYRDKANELSALVPRNSDGTVRYDAFEDLVQDASHGFLELTYEQTYAVFSGSTMPVKKLTWTDYFSERGMTGLTVALTGESAVNPDVPAVGLPFAICHEMAHRMAIYPDHDADFAAFLACRYHPTSVQFQYSGYLMAFRSCYNALASIDNTNAKNALKQVESGTDRKVMADMLGYESFFGADGAQPDDGLSRLLVSWHIQQIVIPQQEAENEANKTFDPMDETDERLQDVVGGTA